jgi:hypothetical protein
VEQATRSARLIWAVFIVSATVGAAAVFSTVLTAGAGTASSSAKPVMFRNPSGNALCVYDTVVKAGQLECAVVSTETASATPLIWRLLPQGVPGAPFRQDNWTGSAIPVIPYGATRRSGIFSCSSLTVGLICWSRVSSHGFLLSRLHQITF